MNVKSTALFALLVPSLAMLAACNRAPPADETTTTPTPAAMSEPPAADTMPAATPPAETPPAATPPADSMASMPGMAGDEMSFASMDKNHDGGVTKDELTATDMLHQHFSVADANADGKLSEAEATKHHADMAAAPAK